MTTLYRAYARRRLLYVGISDNVEQRKQQHRAQPWYPQVTRWTYEDHPTRQAAEVAELAAIRREGPRYNVVGAPQLRLPNRAPYTPDESPRPTPNYRPQPTAGPRGRLEPLTDEQVAELRVQVAESRRRQGLPPTVTDPAVIDRVASIFRCVDLAPEGADDAA